VVEVVTEAPRIPARPTLPSLREAASGCRACELYQSATQVVFGEGPENARLVMVGEHPATRKTARAGRSFGYSDEMVAAATSQAERMRGLLESRFEPFGKGLGPGWNG
jgi:DNA polymerase